MGAPVPLRGGVAVPLCGPVAVPLWGGLAGGVPVPLWGRLAVPLWGPVAVPDCVELERAELLAESGVRSEFFVQAYPPNNTVTTQPATITFFIDV